MKIRDPYRQLGWRHEFWEYVKLYRSLRVRDTLSWRDAIIAGQKINVGKLFSVHLTKNIAEILANYLGDAEDDALMAFSALRSEIQAREACTKLGVQVATLNVKNKDHHQSSKALIAEVSGLALRVAEEHGISVDINPQRRAVWVNANSFHVSSRNLDGAIPALQNPIAIWEIKEYWGKTSGGSKMSDAVYECQLVGRELREYCERSGASVSHIVFLDGRDQWGSRRSDLVRFVDLFHQGLIDHLIIGRQTDAEWPAVLRSLAIKQQ